MNDDAMTKQIHPSHASLLSNIEYSTIMQIFNKSNNKHTFKVFLFALHERYLEQKNLKKLQLMFKTIYASENFLCFFWGLDSSELSFRFSFYFLTCADGQKTKLEWSLQTYYSSILFYAVYLCFVKKSKETTHTNIRTETHTNTDR